MDGISTNSNYLLTIYKGSSETNLSSIIVNYKNNTYILDYIEIHNKNLEITEHRTSDIMVISNYLWDSTTNQFIYNGENQIGEY